MVIGLTGGICSGKSLVSSFFKDKECIILDADLISRQLCEKGQECLDKIIKNFGYDILKKDGSLNRKKIAKIVFNDKGKLSRLESIIHPYVKKEIQKKLNLLGEKEVVVIDAPLLLEAGFDDLVDNVIVVSCNEEKQIQRCIARDGLSEEEIKKRLERQMLLNAKIKKADFIIDNNESKNNTRRQFEDIWTNLMGKKK